MHMYIYTDLLRMSSESYVLENASHGIRNPLQHSDTTKSKEPTGGDSRCAGAGHVIFPTLAAVARYHEIVDVS